MNNSFLSQHLPQLASKTVLITGASGFIGSYLCDQLCQAGAQVHATSRESQVSNRPNLRWWQGSLENLDTTRRLLSQIKPDIVFHLAGEVTAANDLPYILPTYHSLLTSTVNLLTVATEMGCGRIILTGSSTEPVEASATPNSPYSAAKWATNGYGRMFYEIYRSPVVIVRPFMGYGPAQSMRKLIPQVLHAFLRGESPKLSQGRWVTDWVYIEDTVEGFIRAAIVPGIEGQTIDLGTGNLTSVRQIVENIVDILQPAALPLFGALPDRHQEHTREADTENAFRLTGWKAQTPLLDGLRKTIDWYQKAFLTGAEAK